MSTDIKSMFDSIKGSLNVEKNANSGNYRNILKLDPGKTYLVRLIPNISNPQDTFFHYTTHGWTSTATGQYVEALCLKNIGERCPICEARFKLYKNKTAENTALASLIRPLEKHLVKVYVISDPTNQENEGKVKVLRFGKALYDKFLAATQGDDADEYGHRVFDLSENGCNFKIRAESLTSENKRQFTSYSNSRFTSPSAIANMDSAKIQEIYSDPLDLKSLVDMKTAEDMNKLLETHLFQTAAIPAAVTLNAHSASAKTTEKAKSVQKEDNIDMGPSPVATSTPATPNIAAPDKIKNLLASLE